MWQIVRANNCFTRKGMQGEVFSAEKGNLYNKHSYKFSGASAAQPPLAWGLTAEPHPAS